jgi:hypothetical protein
MYASSASTILAVAVSGYQQQEQQQQQQQPSAISNGCDACCLLNFQQQHAMCIAISAQAVVVLGIWKSWQHCLY